MNVLAHSEYVDPTKQAAFIQKYKNKEIADDIVNSPNFKHDRLEIHHINNRPDDNRVDNLIWLPRSIHCQAHKYEIDEKSYTFELTIDEHKKVNAFIEYVLRG